MDGRRNFLKTAFATCSLLAGSKLLTACTPIKRAASEEEETFETFATPNALKGMPIKATFLDEISWDIPHQNWGTKEWDKDFKAMKKMGINTVVQSPNQKIPDRKTKCVIKTHINIKQNVIFGAKLKPV